MGHRAIRDEDVAPRAVTELARQAAYRPLANGADFPDDATCPRRVRAVLPEQPDGSLRAGLAGRTTLLARSGAGRTAAHRVPLGEPALITERPTPPRAGVPTTGERGLSADGHGAVRGTLEQSA